MLKEKQKNGSYNGFSIVVTAHTYHHSYRNQADVIIVLQIVIGIWFINMTLKPLI